MMKISRIGISKILICLGCILTFYATEVFAFSKDPIHHDLQIELEPSSRFAKIQDTIKFKTSPINCDSFAFYLHSGLTLNHHQVPAGWKLQSDKSDDLSLIKLEITKSSSIPCPGTFSMTLDYSGIVHDPDSDGTTGFIFSGSSYFYPQALAESSLVTFAMQVTLPEPWQAVSQGLRAGNELSGESKVVTWKSSRPSEEIYLIGNQFHIYELEYNGLFLYAFLLQEEKELADRYLETAKGYIDFYSALIGPYPYEKFALVENARQTGYGMPSFTLMGSRIIRFPFILHSSYPHEILHNWWGNGVFPVMKEGNWSEGLTAYLADHLLLEVKGKGAPYRFQEMMKFSNYVNEANEFPLSEFSYRDSMASQAIGYAKLLMVFHMLRIQVGDENFLEGLKKFYATHKYRYAGYEDMRKVFEKVSGQSLREFFEQWLNRRGAPRIKLGESSYVFREGRYDLKVRVKQDSPAFRLRIPIAIWTTDSKVGEVHYIKLDAEEQDLNFQLEDEPVAVWLDPFNDVFRLPSDEEAPASLAQTYGAQIVVALLPKNESLDYQKFAEAVAKPEKILTSDDNSPLPDGSLWIFGQDHPLKKSIMRELKKSGIEVSEKGVLISGRSYPWENHSFVFTLNRLDPKKGTITWVIAGNMQSIPGLMRKLPHYGKYGYLVFEGSAPQNRDKGVWPSNPAGLLKVFKEGQPRLLPEQKPLVSFKPFP